MNWIDNQNTSRERYTTTAMMTSDTSQEPKRRSRSKSPSPTKSTASKSSSSSPSLKQRLFNDFSAELPPGWKEYRDKSTGQVYYAKKATGESSWERPKLSKQDKKELKKQRSDLNAKRDRSSSTKTSESRSQFSIEYTKEVTEVQKTVSFSNEDQIRTYRVEPVERKKESPSKKFKKVAKSTSNKPVVKPAKKSSPTKQRQGDPKNETKALEKIRKKTVVNSSSKASDPKQKSSFMPFKLGWRKKRKDKIVKELSPKEKSVPAAPSSLLGIRNKSLKRNVSAKEQQVAEPMSEATTTISKVASLPTESSPARSSAEASDMETSIETPSVLTKLSALPKSSTKSTETTASTSDEESPQKAEKQAVDKSSTSTFRPTSKIASLLKPAVKSDASKVKASQPRRSDRPINSLESTEKDSASKTSAETKSDAPPASPGELTLNEKNEATENLAASSPESGITKLKALTITLIGSNQLSKQANDDETSKRTVEPVLSTPPRKTVPGPKDGSPASITLASSLPCSELIFDKDLEVDCDSLQEKETKPQITPTKQEKETKPQITPTKQDKEKENKSEGISPSKLVNSLFKKNRSKDSKEKEDAVDFNPEVTASEPEVVPPPKAEVINLDTVAKKELVKNDDVSDGDTHTAGSSASGIHAEQEPFESGWVVEHDDDLGVDFKEIKESRCGDCGCSQSMHESLLFFGGMIYKVVGKPNDDLRATMEDAGDLFADEDSQDGSEY